VKVKNVGSKKQLFIDEAFFASTHNVKLTMNPPRKTDERTIYPDKPWELLVGEYDSIIKVGDEYRCYYTALMEIPKGKEVKFFGNPWDHEFVCCTCLAVSKDGIDWEKPNLGLIEYGGTRNTNIIFPPKILWNETCNVFIDTKPGIPDDEKFKATVAWAGPKGQHDGGIWVLKSADGVRFVPMTDEPVYYNSDTDNRAFWDERINKYVIYFRDNSDHYVEDTIYQEVQHGNRREILTNKAGRTAPDHESGVLYRDYAFRKVRRYEVDDLREQWSYEKSQVVAQADSQEAPGTDYNANSTQKYPWADDVYLMFPGLMRHLYHPPYGLDDLDQSDPISYNDAVQEIRLMTSRDGINFKYISRQPFIPRGVRGNYDSGYVTVPAVGMIRDGANLYLYSGNKNHNVRHGAVPLKAYRENPAFISRLVMRLDGFVSVDTDNAGGEFTTVPMTFQGSALELNHDCFVAGYLIVELLKDGKPIEGFTFKDCDLIEDNYIDKTVTWNGNSDVSALQGQPVQLRFVMRNTKLYAFQFVNSL